MFTSSIIIAASLGIIRKFVFVHFSIQLVFMRAEEAPKPENLTRTQQPSENPSFITQIAVTTSPPTQNFASLALLLPLCLKSS